MTFLMPHGVQIMSKKSFYFKISTFFSEKYTF